MIIKFLLLFKSFFRQLLRLLIGSCLLLLAHPLFAAVPACKDSQLSIRLIEGSLLGMDGASSETYGIINHGSEPCYLRGIPSVKLPSSIQKGKSNFVNYLLTKRGQEDLIDSDQDRRKPPRTIIQPFHAQDTLKQLAFFNIYYPGGGTAEDDCYPYPLTKIETLKLPGINKSFSISIMTSCFVISDVSKDASYDTNEEDSDNQTCTLGEEEGAKTYTKTQLNALPLKKIIAKKISCEY